ncbi:hypothetical protein B5S29_g337 [[Candida] boidinii]|nr:hypothetical protein B5S29_g337 [[Candida] boidinii]
MFSTFDNKLSAIETRKVKVFNKNKNESNNKNTDNSNKNESNKPVANGSSTGGSTSAATTTTTTTTTSSQNITNKIIDFKSNNIVCNNINASNKDTKSKTTSFKIPIIKNKSFVGVTSRSKFGCTNCRSKKKKCDEVYPICGLCSKKGVVCTWNEKRSSKDKLNFDLKALQNSHEMIKNINKAKMIAEEQKKIKKLEQKQKQKEKQNKNDNKNTKNSSSSNITSTISSGSNSTAQVTKQQISSNNVPNTSNKRSKSTSTTSEPKNKRAKNSNNDGSSKIKFVMTELVVENKDSIESVPVKKSSSLPLTSSTKESQSHVDMARSQSTTTSASAASSSSSTSSSASDAPSSSSSTSSEDLIPFEPFISPSSFLLSPNFLSYKENSDGANGSNTDNNNDNSNSNNKNGPIVDENIEEILPISTLSPRSDDNSTSSLKNLLKLATNGNSNDLYSFSPSSFFNDNNTHFSPISQFFKSVENSPSDHLSSRLSNNGKSNNNEENASVIRHDLNPNVPFILDKSYDKVNSNNTQDDDEYDEYQSNSSSNNNSSKSNLSIDFPALDESQVVENQGLSDGELLNLTVKSLKNKKGLGAYLNPAFHLLFPPSPTLFNPSSNFTRNLDDTGKLFLDHYKTYVVNMITICSADDSNFFLGYFMKLADIDESILNAIVAWGGMFLVGRKNELSIKYFNNALELAKKNRSKTSFSKNDYLISLTFFIITMGSQISTGDVQTWYHLFLQFKELLSTYGGLTKFVKDNLHSSEAKLIISNFLYHDVMATQSLNSGTLVDINEYKELFQQRQLLDFDSYILDPLQGCLQEIVLVLGEIVNMRCKLKNMRIGIDTMKSNYLNYIKNNKSTNHASISMLGKIQESKNSYLANVNQIFNDLKTKINNTKPGFSQVRGLTNNKDELELHLTLFELFQIILNIYIKISIKSIPFHDDKIQILIPEIKTRLDILIGTKLQSPLCLIFLIGSIICIKKEDRLAMEERYERLSVNYHVGNMVRVWSVIEEVWRRSDLYYDKLNSKKKNGGHDEDDDDADEDEDDAEEIIDINVFGDESEEETCVDWCDVVDDFGWNICFS